MSRSPKIQMEARDIERICTMGDADAGRVMKWGMESHAGRPVDMSKVLEADPQAARTIALCGAMLDANELASGRIVVTSFREAGKKARRLSITRAEARSKRSDIEQDEEHLTGTGTGKVLQMFTSNGSRHGDARTKKRNTLKKNAGQNVNERDAAELTEVVDSLCLHGVKREQAERVVKHLSQKYTSAILLQAVRLMDGRAIGTPDKYLAVTAESLMKVDNCNVGPKPLRRRTAMNKGARWQHLGWTCEGHPRSSGNGVEGRRKVWRNDVGGLSYKPADSNETIPTFEEDAGTYEVE